MNQFEMKQLAYQSQLRSRALQVLLYLIDRSNKEQTCFPAVSTIGRELHISISTVKRAMRELVEAGYVTKESRFREGNRGQTSNLYTLFFTERAEGSCENQFIGSKNNEDDKEIRDSEEASASAHICNKTRLLKENTICEKSIFQDLEKKENFVGIHMSGIRMDGGGCIEMCVVRDKVIKVLKKECFAYIKSCLVFKWTGEGVNLIPP